jgi:hypothetical protein
VGVLNFFYIVLYLKINKMNLEQKINKKHNSIDNFKKNNNPNRYGYNETLNRMEKELRNLEIESLK